MLCSQKIGIIFLTCLFLPANAILQNYKLQAQATEGALDDVVTSFVTPSGNIYCALIGEEQNTLRCEMQSMLNPLPPQPYSGYCEFDWGAGFLLRQQGKPEILCISDSIGKSSYILAYDSTWAQSGFECVSKRAGLRCENASEHGFFLSRNAWNAF